MSLILIPENLFAVSNELNWLKFISTRARTLFQRKKSHSFIRLKNIAERFTSESTKSRRFGNSLHVTSQRNPTKLTTWVYRFSCYRFSKRHELKSGGDENCIIAVGNCLMTARKKRKRRGGRKSWLFFPLPIIIVWIFFLLPFFAYQPSKTKKKEN